MKETIEHNNRFYGEELKTESEQLKEWLVIANEENERLNNIIIQLENERDILKSKLSETKADIHYLLGNGESIYIRNKYIRGDKNE